MNDTFKGQLDLEQHGGRTIEGVGVRVAQRSWRALRWWGQRHTGQTEEVAGTSTGSTGCSKPRMLLMGDEGQNEAEAPTFLSAVAVVARLLGLDNATSVPEDLSARRLAHAVRKPLLERVGLSEEFFAPLMAAAVYDPDPSFCRWFIEPALYAFGRRRVTAALLNYARTGTDAEQAGAKRAWYCAHLPLRADRSPAFAPGGSRDPALDESHDVVDEWLQYTAAPEGNGS